MTGPGNPALLVMGMPCGRLNPQLMWVRFCSPGPDLGFLQSRLAHRRGSAPSLPGIPASRRWPRQQVSTYAFEHLCELKNLDRPLVGVEINPSDAHTTGGVASHARGRAAG